MKVTKTQAVLALYDDFLQKKVLRKKDYLAQVEVSDISFKRYISELRCYFMNFAPRFDIAYRRKEDAYYLIDNDREG
jgi:hypothetical protein